MTEKFVVYQIFTRLFGNTKCSNRPWGTIEENGVGKFSDFTHQALSEIKQLGVSHVWYTGIPHHALIHDYSDFGISHDHPAVVKGRAGSPYAVKDYYSVNPDLADNPAHRQEEFYALIERTHQHGLKVIIDIVPNHVARCYKGLNNPNSINDFGSNDDTDVEYARDNNFYYIPQQGFVLPDIPKTFQYVILETKTSDYQEYPAKWTGNGARKAKPDFDDWYETAKVNYGMRPDGSKDFPELPDGYAEKSYQEHYSFWQNQSVPDSWIKFRDIALYWLEKGVDGFRYDMAEMVPVEFWSFMNSSIRMEKSDAFLLAEVYEPQRYRDYIHLGKMNYLYDKVDLYDQLKAIMQGKASTASIVPIQEQMADIDNHMLRFLENHDEQRIASPEFAGNPELARPAMLLSAALGRGPTLIYFGQEVGETAAEQAGFGQPSRTSIFDYIGVPTHQRWMNNGRFDGGQLSEQEKLLRKFYQSVLIFSLTTDALTGSYFDLYTVNQTNMGSGRDHCFLFSRKSAAQLVIVAVNFHLSETFTFPVTVPCGEIDIADGHYILDEVIERELKTEMDVQDGIGLIRNGITLPPLAASAYCVNL